MIEGLHDLAPQAVHNRQSLSYQDVNDTPHKDKAQHDFVTYPSRGHLLINFFLEGTRQHIKGYYDLKGQCDGPAHQDDELHLVDATDHSIEVVLHHDARHLEVQVEEGDQEGDDDEQVQADVDSVEDCEAQLIDVVDYHWYQQDHSHSYLQTFQAVA